MLKLHTVEIAGGVLHRLPEQRVCSTVMISVLFLGAIGCKGPEVDRITDPTEKAAYHCRYVLERELAKPDELNANGVLRKSIAEFQPPRMERAGDQISFFWDHGAIKRSDSSKTYGGDCSMLISKQFVVKATLDGRSLHAGFSF